MRSTLPPTSRAVNSPAVKVLADLYHEQIQAGNLIRTLETCWSEIAYLQFGETVAVFAQGPVGLCATMGANLMGAGRIIAVESRPERQALASGTRWSMALSLGVERSM